MTTFLSSLKLLSEENRVGMNAYWIIKETDDGKTT